MQQLDDVRSLTPSIGGKTAGLGYEANFRCGCWLMEKEKRQKAITRNLDRDIWRDLI